MRLMIEITGSVYVSNREPLESIIKMIDYLSERYPNIIDPANVEVTFKI